MNFLYRRLSGYILIVILSMTLNVATAQKKWSLMECVQMALDNNLQMVAVENNLELAEINLRQSQHARYPSLSGSVNLNNSFGRTVDPTTNSFINQSFLSNGLSLNSGVLLFNGFRINNTISQSRLNALASKKDINQLERDITLNVATAFLNVIFAKENITINENQLEQSIAQRELMQKMIRVGNSPENAIFDLDAQVAQNEQNLVTARNNLELANLTLRQLIRLDPAIPFDIQVPDIEVDKDLYTLLSIEELTENAFRNQPSLEASKLRINVAEKGEKIAEAGFYPTLSAGGSLITNFSNRFQQPSGNYFDTLIKQEIIFNGQPVFIESKQQIPIFESIPYFNQLNNNFSYGVGLNLSIPIYSNYSVRAAKSRAVVTTNNAKNNYEILKDNIKVTVAQSYAEAKAAKSRFEAAEKTFQAQSNVYNNALKRFETGNLNSYDLVRFKTLYETAQTNVLIAKYDLFFRYKVLDFYLGKPIVIK
ncbi:MAG: TolC family protein [Saprospiraceae bacterium]|nr:TolC family protein [Saprospiraceae bacterium]MBK8081996.1 TolC family protein [Saprospiraceae bacterium]MBK8370486.1 TolC family protein [Saprospiraceae bacterium]MBP6695145.1 TolC family protein [Saprospiraceae bacterium]